MKKKPQNLPHQRYPGYIRFFRAFYFAARGILSALKERNMKFHAIVTVLILGFGWYFQLSHLEWTIVAILIGSVLAAEMFNTAIEELADIVRDEIPVMYEGTTRARDVAAGAVLVLSIVAAILGGLIFWPYFVYWLQ